MFIRVSVENEEKSELIVGELKSQWGILSSLCTSIAQSANFSILSWPWPQLKVESWDL